MWATALYEHPLPSLQWGAVLGASLGAALLDLRSRRIPNWLTLPLLAGGLSASIAIGGVSAAIDALAGCALMSLPFVLLFFVRGGAGDAKLMGALGAWLGLAYGTIALVAVCLSGVVLAVLFAGSRGRLAAVLANVRGIAKGALLPVFGAGSVRDASSVISSAEDGEQMPYGLAIFAGVLITAVGAFAWNA